jgi:hypothetical protein
MPHVYPMSDNSPGPSMRSYPKSSPKPSKPRNPLEWARAKNQIATNGIQTNGITHTNGKFRPPRVSSPNKRKAIEMIDSDDEEERKLPPAPNGITRTSTPNGRRHRKKQRMSNGVTHQQKSENLLEQRQALPIWTGVSSCRSFRAASRQLFHRQKYLGKGDPRT